MKVIDPGHVYQLDGLDNAAPQFICFVKRDNPPERFPGNVGHHAGIQIQELLRVILDRFAYLNNQNCSGHNDKAIEHIKGAFIELEQRAAERHGRKLNLTTEDIINTDPCLKCGHVGCIEPTEARRDLAIKVESYFDNAPWKLSGEEKVILAEAKEVLDAQLREESENQ